MINLPAASAGQNVRLRFRLTSDSSMLASTTNLWRIDTVQRQVTTLECAARTPTNLTMSATGPVHRGQPSVVTAMVSGAPGTPTGSVAVTGAGASCNVTLAVGTSNCSLPPSLVGSNQTINGSYLGSGTHAPGSGSTTLTVKSTLDIDDNGATLVGSDVVLALRHLFGLSGSALTNSVTFCGGAQRTAPTAITNLLVQIRPLLDIDGDTKVNPMTDGLLITRYLLGLRGIALIQGAVAPSPGATRTSATDIENYIRGLIQ